MCLIVFKRNHNSVFTNRQFKNMISNNGDGLGIMYVEDGRVKTHKSVGSDKEKFKLFQEHRNKTTYAMHARYKTHGLINEANCHPYEIMNIDKGDPIDMFVMHNGVLSDAPDLNRDMSDTWHYMEYMLKPLIKADIDLMWNSEHIQKMITKAIGSSKLLFMRSDPVKYQILIFNSDLGDDETGCWLSNKYSCSDSYRRSYTAGAASARNDNTYKNKTGKWCDTRKAWVYESDDERDESEEKKEVIASGDIRKWTQKGFEDRWEDAQRAKFREKDFTKKGTLFLPNEQKDDKIIKLRSDMIIENPKEGLLDLLRTLRSFNDVSLKEYMRNDPEETADLIMGLYAKNTMDWETIIRLIKHPNRIDDMVNLIRHMAIDEEIKQRA